MSNATGTDQYDLWDFDPDERIRRCRGCGIVKPLSEFYSHPNAAAKFDTRCKDCAKQAMRDHRAANSDAMNAALRQKRKEDPERFRNHDLKKLGLTVELYNAMLADQGGGCAICGQPCTSGRNLAIDHDHACCPSKSKACGKCVRGLLCANCNNGLGRFNDDPDLLLAAAQYLRRTLDL